VSSLREYARVTDQLGASAGVRGVQLAEAAGARAPISGGGRGGAAKQRGARSETTSE
jgi:hypothetical protein